MSSLWIYFVKAIKSTKGNQEAQWNSLQAELARCCDGTLTLLGFLTISYPLPALGRDRVQGWMG